MSERSTSPETSSVFETFEKSSFKPESIVAILAALGSNRTEKENLMLARFLAAATVPSLFDYDNHRILSVEGNSGIYLGVFSEREIIKTLDEPIVRKLERLEGCTVNIRTVIPQVLGQTSGVILNPYSDLAVEFPWNTLISELGEYDRLTRIDYFSTDKLKFICTVWDPELIEGLQTWLKNKEGVAQLMLALVPNYDQDTFIRIYLDCVPSVLDESTRDLKSHLSRSLPSTSRFQIRFCGENVSSDELQKAGAYFISR